MTKIDGILESFIFQFKILGTKHYNYRKDRM